MRILVYKDSLANGRGADRMVRTFAEGLSARGHAVCLLEKSAFVQGVKDAFGTFSPDVVVPTGSNEALDLWRAFPKGYPWPVVLQLHLAPRGFLKFRHVWRNHCIRKAFDSVDAVQVLCTDYGNEFHALAPHPAIQVIGNFTDRMGERIDNPPPVALYPAASLTNDKNQLLAIRAFARVADTFPAWRLVLLGNPDTSYGLRCRKLVQHLALSDRILFPGFTHDLDAFYRQARFTLSTSRLEGFPLAFLEAAAWHLPVLARVDLPGVRDFIEPDVTGLLASSSVSAYALSLAHMMADPALCKRLGEAAYAKLNAQYTHRIFFDKWEAFLLQWGKESCRKVK